MGAPQRGIIHSAFDAAANIVFPGDFVLSLNAASFSQHSGDDLPLPRMPNGVQITAPAGTFPFTALRVGMPVLFGAQRLHIEAIACSLDLSLCSQWNPHIEHPTVLDMEIIRKNRGRLAGYVSVGVEVGWEWDLVPARAWDFSYWPIISNPDNGWAQGSPLHSSPPSSLRVRELAQSLCGRGIGLTPSGDDMLAGWMAAGWLLHGPMPGFLNACQQIVEVAKRQTHLLSQCWLGYAAEGNVAQPICALLDTLTRDDERQLSIATEAVLAMGATSGRDVIQGILLMLNEI
jgi:hypothetical protein